MLLQHTLSIFSLLACLKEVRSASTPSYIDRSISWFHCQQNATWPVTCGTLAVPLDYTNSSSNKSLILNLLKFNATKSPSKGSILFNPGGPGQVTREFLAAYAQEMLISTGGHYHLIAFDTRGTGATIPFSCFDSNLDRTAQESMVLVTSNASDTSAGRLWTSIEGFVEECHEQNKDIGELMSTAFVARDMMQIVDALDEDGMLRYFGLSYGTVLGATAASMFPDRVDKMVFDGVVNSPEWYAGTNREEVLQADDTVRAFVRDCLAAPESCPLARKNLTTDSLFNDIVTLLEDVKYNGILLGNNLTTDLVEYNGLYHQINNGVKGGIRSVSTLAFYLDAVMRRNLTAYKLISTELSTPSPTLYPNLGPEAICGIHCPDTALRTDDFSTMEPLLKVWYESKFGGEIMLGLQGCCARWKMRSKETYSGPFKATTKNPILLISSPYDPATPMISAQNMSAGFEGSVVLQHNHIGHCSISQPSKCVIDATRAYFENGTLPTPNTICEPDFNLFANYTVKQIYKMSENGELEAH